MSNRRRRWMAAGMAAGATAGLAAALVAQAGQRRLALAGQVGPVTQQAVERLGVPAESRLMQAGDAVLHTVVAGGEQDPLVVLLHGFPDCWKWWAELIKSGPNRPPDSTKANQATIDW